MLMRILTMRVVHERLEDWMRYTRDIGFPSMLSQAGCTKIKRMRRQGAEAGEYEVATWWGSLDELNQFNASSAMRELTASASGLTIPPHREVLYEVVDD